jgi:hypothetical protein
MHLIFDATGIARSFPIYALEWWSEGLAAQVRLLFSQQPVEQILCSILTERFFRLVKLSVESSRPVTCVVFNN